MPDARKNILLVDDHPIVAEGLKTLLDSTQDLTMIGTCPSPESARAFLADRRPDLILMDISMKGANGLHATKDLTASHPHIPILIFTCNDEKIYASMAASVGAKGLVMKDQPEEEILRAMRTVLQGRAYLPPRIGKHPAPPPTPRESRSAHRRAKLSKKELEIIGFLADGYSSVQMALALNVGLQTIEIHRLRIRQKLGIDSQNDLVRWAVCHRTKGLPHET